MEALILVGIAIIIVAVMLPVGGKKAFRTQPKPGPQSEPGPQSAGNILPFDVATAHKQASETVLYGPARVVDGDTVVIAKTQVRLYGIDAPELDHPYGKKAKWALVAMCKGRKVRAVVTDTDDYGRTVAKCFLDDGTDLSAQMVLQGLAIDWPKFSGGQYRNLETPDARKKLWLADARQKGRIHVWEQFEAKKRNVHQQTD